MKKYKCQICTVAALFMVSSSTLFLRHWIPWMIEVPNWLIYVGYGFIAISGFLDPYPEAREWIFRGTILVCVLRQALLLIEPNTLPISLSDSPLVVKCVEPIVVLLIALTCFTHALWHRLITEA
jgi:hypothetical protein